VADGVIGILIGCTPIQRLEKSAKHTHSQIGQIDTNIYKTKKKKKAKRQKQRKEKDKNKKKKS
jgi:hypothetical protein